MTWRTPTADRTPRRTVLRADFDGVHASAGLWHDVDTDTAERQGLQDAVRTAVATVLTSRQREVVEMHFFEGLSQGDIARRLGVSQQVVQKCLYGVARRGHVVGGALRRLREVLGPRVSS